MGTMKIRHNDLTESMEKIAKELFGTDVELLTKEGKSGEKILYVIGDKLSPHSIEDIERREWVLSAEYIK